MVDSIVAMSVLLGIGWACLGVWVSTTDPTSSMNLPLQYGALGILAFMIWTNSHERKKLVQSMEEKDRAFRKIFQDHIASCNQMMATLDKIMTALGGPVLKEGETGGSHNR